MNTKKRILGINGSASQNSSNHVLLNTIAELGQDEFDLILFEDLTTLPHFRTELTQNDVPKEVVSFRQTIAQADGIIICTPEYVFSIPSRLKMPLNGVCQPRFFATNPWR